MNDIIALPDVPRAPVTATRLERLDEAALGRLLGVLTARPGPLPKYLYPSAGTLYPVQTYISLRDGVAGCAGGSYYHDPSGHALAPLSADLVPAPDGSHPAALLLLVAKGDAIAPIYKDLAAGFCLLEAGYMMEALARAASGIGLALRDAGDPAQANRLPIATALRLEDDHWPLVCWAIEGAP